jgi:hypothetical protein
MEYNYLRENGAVSFVSGLYQVEYDKMPGAIQRLATELLTIEATGDRARAEAWFAKYGKIPSELTAALEKTKDIPVDIEPVFSFKDEVR